MFIVAWGGVASAHVARVGVDFLALGSALKTFRIEAGRYPTQEEGLKALLERPDTYPADRRWQQVMKKLPADPWGNPFHYIASRSPDGEFGLYSTGADGVSHSHGDDPDDWNSWSENGRGRKAFVDELRDVPVSFWLALVTLAFAIGAVVRARGHRT